MANIGVGRAAVPDSTGQSGPEPPLGLADRLDELLLRLEVWRERSAVVVVLAVVSGLAAAGAWWLARPQASVPVEDMIPMADPEDRPVGPGDGRTDAALAGATAGAGAVGSGPTGGPIAGAAPGMGVAVEADTLGRSMGGSAPGVGSEIGATEREQRLVVHVVGEVRRPGLVRLPIGSRVADAVEAAGGRADEADLEQLNLAAPVSDGMQVRVPARGAEPDGPLIVTAEPIHAEASAAGPLNLNTAAAIITWREDNGGFLTVDDLTQVPGIGPVKLAALRDLVTV